MNIGIVTTWFERGAAYVSKEFEAILSQENNVFIFARGGESFAKGDPKWDTPNVHWSQYPIIDKYINRREFKSWVKRNKIEMVLFNEQPTFSPIIWCKELGVKTVAYIDYYKECTIPLFGLFDALICNTKRHASAFEEHPNVLYIPWGTDTELYKPLTEDGGLVEEGKVTFFNSAGMNPRRKGTDTFIKALAKCKGKKNIKAIIHSQKELKLFFPELVTTIDELLSIGMLEIVEKTITAPGLYYKADVYVYPSILDGIGLTVPEALSSGLACVVSDNPPMTEFVNSSSGAYIPVTRLYARSDGYYWPQCRCDIDALAKIIEYFADNPSEVIRKKLYSREFAVQNLSFSKNAFVLSSMLKDVKYSDPDERLIKIVKDIEGGWNNKLIEFILSYNLYKLPINRIRRKVSYRG